MVQESKRFAHVLADALFGPDAERLTFHTAEGELSWALWEIEASGNWYVLANTLDVKFAPAPAMLQALLEYVAATPLPDNARVVLTRE
jgi:hypothetical protein